MIVFDLRCSNDHVFEAWFASTAAYDEQRDRALVSCPICSDTSVAKALMAPNIGAKGNSRAVPTPMEVKAALKALAGAQQQALEGSRWVGGRCAEEARAMHLGEREQETIHGKATLAEAKALVEEGVPVAALPFPVLPPEKAN